jgi:hypothetical protein
MLKLSPILFPDFLYLPIPLCRIPLRHYYRASQRDRRTNDDEEKGS